MNLDPPLHEALLEQSFGLFRLSRMIYAVAELGIATQLVNGPRSADELAELTGTHAPSLASLLDVLACWGVFRRDPGGRYALTPVSERLVPGSAKAANVPMLMGWAGFPGMYEAFGEILQTLRTGESALRREYGGFHGYLAAKPDMRALYDRAMESTADSFAASARAADFSGARHLVDVGGGKGALALEILSLHPQLRATCFDLPDVVAQADVAGHPAASRLEFAAGDAFECVPAGADAYVTSTVLRCFDDERCLSLLRNIRNAMGEDAKLVAFEMVMPEGRDHIGMCTADLVARVLYGGRDRTESEFKSLFERAGLRHMRTGVATGICALEAQPA